ncbi:hypothetical protein VTL71DRAFT_11655 [Oculimacula yallundae]|uniref:Protein kinase domain-containing protein n=1 Tax=Oculimacula yallundae TaxID=86028 RepID=A0ABR4CRD6_9HELO
MEDTIPRYAVVDFAFGVNLDAQLTAICRTKRFYITLSAENLRDPKHTEASEYEQEYLRLLHAIQFEDQAEFNPGEPDPFEAMTHWVVTPFFPVFRELAPQLSSTPQMQTLQEYFNPLTFFFTLKVVNGTLTPIPTPEKSHNLEFLTPSMELPPFLLDADVPIFNPSSLNVDWDPESEGAQFPTKVFGDKHEPYFFKATARGNSAAITREIEMLLSLERAGLSAKIRVPRLSGYVQDNGQKNVIGLLLTYIERKDTLQGILLDKPELALRKKWFLNIEYMLKLLHKADIVWGDAKADNILIDMANKAWMIDFGGSYTFGWVDKDKINTIEGDLQGLQRIKEYLEVE